MESYSTEGHWEIGDIDTDLHPLQINSCLKSKLPTKNSSELSNYKSVRK